MTATYKSKEVYVKMKTTEKDLSRQIKQAEKIGLEFVEIITGEK